MVYCLHEKRGKGSLYIYIQLILLYETLKSVAVLLTHPVYPLAPSSPPIVITISVLNSTPTWKVPDEDEHNGH